MHTIEFGVFCVYYDAFILFHQFYFFLSCCLVFYLVSFHIALFCCCCCCCCFYSFVSFIRGSSVYVLSATFVQWFMTAITIKYGNGCVPNTKCVPLCVCSSIFRLSCAFVNHQVVLQFQGITTLNIMITIDETIRQHHLMTETTSIQHNYVDDILSHVAINLSLCHLIAFIDDYLT